MLTYDLSAEEKHKKYLAHLAEPSGSCMKGGVKLASDLHLQKVRMTTEQKYGFFKGREKSVPFFGELDGEDFDAADKDTFEKLKGEVRAQGENLSLDK